MLFFKLHLLGDTPLISNDASASVIPVDVRLLGSRSFEFIDIAACLLFPQLEVTTRAQARQQIILLQVRGLP